MLPKRLLLLLGVFCAVLHAEEMRLTRESLLRQGPNETSASVGKLPEGSIVVKTAKSDGTYQEVRVELEDGSYVQGWVPKSLLAISEVPPPAPVPTPSQATPPPAFVPPEEPAEPGEPREPRAPRVLNPGRRAKVPADEMILLKREATFFYGAHMAGNYSFFQSSSKNYRDLGGRLGAQAGIWLFPFLPICFELGYSLLRGTADDGSGFDLGFIDSGAYVGYLVRALEVSAGVAYSYCSSVYQLPSEITPGIPADLSSVYGVVGIGLRVKWGEMNHLIFRGTFRYSFAQSPLASQVINFEIAFDING